MLETIIPAQARSFAQYVKVIEEIAGPIKTCSCIATVLMAWNTGYDVFDLANEIAEHG